MKTLTLKETTIAKKENYMMMDSVSWGTKILSIWRQKDPK